ncbi:hypothetical protein, partial [Candidatus Cyanaurora vandensis]
MGSSHRGRRGFSLLFVLLVGVLLVALAGSLLVLSNSQSQRTVAGRERLLAETSAESGLGQMVAVFREGLLGLGQDGNAPPESAEDPYVFNLGAQFYFGATLIDGNELVLDSYLDDRPLATDFEQVVERARGRQFDQQWWLYSLGEVQWRPLDIPELIANEGIARIAERDMVVVGEAFSALGYRSQRQVRARNLGFYVDFNDPLVGLKPAAAVALVPVLGYDTSQNKQSILAIIGSLSSPSPVKFEGPLIVDTQEVTDKAIRSRGQAELSFTRSLETSEDNKTLYPTVSKPNEGFWQIGAGVSEIDPQTKSIQPQTLPTDRRNTLQLDLSFAQALGALGTTFGGEFKSDEDILAADGALLYDSANGHFDLSKLRNGILHITTKPLLLTEEKFKAFTYSGRGTIVITAPGPQGLVVRNASLVPRDDDPNASLSIIAAPEPQPTSPDLPFGVTATVPSSVELSFQSPLVPQTVLADSQDRVVTFDCSPSSRLASLDPLIPTDPQVRRTNGVITVGQLSIPQSSRAYALGDTCVVLARLQRDQTEVILSFGSDPQGGRLQPQLLFNARSVPLQRVQAEIYSMNPVIIRSANRIIGRLVAPRLRILPGPAGILYGADQLDRYQLDFIYRNLPATVGSWLLTLRSDITPRPVPLPITYLEPRQWRTLPASVLTNTGEQ